jgi:ADP-ribosylglycohydrolase
MICKVFGIDLLDFQGFNSLNFRKPMLFEYKSNLIKFSTLSKKPDCRPFLNQGNRLVFRLYAKVNYFSMNHRRSFLQKSGWAFATAFFGFNSSFANNQAKFNQNLSAKPLLLSKLEEALYAHVIADAMGGSVENNLPEQTLEKFGTWDFNNFLPPTKKKDIEEKKGKGDGRTTDDSLNLEAMIGCYLRHQDHLDAYDYADAFIKEITEKKVWIAERAESMTPNDRPLWWPERYVFNRLTINNIEPRYAGMGNYINEGFQGIVLPVGAVNVGDPWRAYDEVTSFGLAHTESFGLEAAGVNAACYAVAFQKNSTIEEILKTALSVAKDGSKMALEAVLAVVNLNDSFAEFSQKTREAVLPYLQLSPELLKNKNIETPKQMREGTNIARPSRIACVENFPIALAALKYGNGDYFKTLKAGIFYGRDAETIAAVATSLLSALKGPGTVPEKLKKEVDTVNRRDYAQLAAGFFDTIKKIYAKDKERLERRGEVL